MITISDKVLRQRKNFWNNCHFHPTDAIEDAWGKIILDKMADDGAIKTVRMYTMFEDIVTKDENNELQYDFRLNDLRIDYMLEKGFDILLTYNFMPDCIAKNKNTKASVSKNPTRYKGKMINTSVPEDYKLWEEVCYNYTKHIIERYGIEIVSKWHLLCYNEPDIYVFFMSDLPGTPEYTRIRMKEYCKLYRAFENGVRRASKELLIGGPALACNFDFLEGFLNYIKEQELQMNFISVHNYGTNPQALSDGSCPLTVDNTIKNHEKCLDIIRRCGFEDKEIIIDEWGVSSMGFFDKDEAPALIFRETEVFAAYYAKMICKFIDNELPVSKMLICLSGQHEMVEDFSGFRNFFTLNFIKKPIYNAYILASKLGDNILSAKCNNENICVTATKNSNGDIAILISYSSEYFEDIPEIEENIEFEDDIEGKNIKIYCIDKFHTNPYEVYKRKGIKEITEKDIRELRKSGELQPVQEYTYTTGDKISLNLSSNAVFMIYVS